MMGDGARTLGERVTELRTRRGLSQRELAGEVGRSESWVSQVERDVLKVERRPVLRALADALGVSVRDLSPDGTEEVAGGEPRGGGDLDSLRLVLTGHPAPDLLLAEPSSITIDLQSFQDRVTAAWGLTHASEFAAVNAALVQLLPELERAWRQARKAQRAPLARLLADA